MKLSLLQQDLLPVVSAVSRSVGRTNLPVLANILIQTENGKLKLSATNLEIGVIKRVSAQVEEEGEVSVPAKTFLETISSLNAEKITLEASADQLKLTTSNFKATLNGIPASEFPAIPLSSDQTITIDAKILKDSLPKITFAAAVEEGRPVLTGILTQIKQNTLELVATDGFRLAHQKSPLKGEAATEFKALIPRRTFEEVVRLIDEDIASEKEETVQIATSENQNQIIFKIGQTEVSSRLIEGQFPSWDKIIPQKFENRTVLDRGELLKAVKLASVFAREASHILKIQTGSQGLKIASETKELGSQETELEGQSEGAELLVALNSKFLLEALSACTSSQVSVEFSGILTPTLIKPIGEEGLEYIIMPVRLN